MCAAAVHLAYIKGFKAFDLDPPEAYLQTMQMMGAYRKDDVKIDQVKDNALRFFDHVNGALKTRMRFDVAHIICEPVPVSSCVVFVQLQHVHATLLTQHVHSLLLSNPQGAAALREVGLKSLVYAQGVATLIEDGHVEDAAVKTALMRAMACMDSLSRHPVVAPFIITGSVRLMKTSSSTRKWQRSPFYAAARARGIVTVLDPSATGDEAILVLDASRFDNSTDASLRASTLLACSYAHFASMLQTNHDVHSEPQQHRSPQWPQSPASPLWIDKGETPPPQLGAQSEVQYGRLVALVQESAARDVSCTVQDSDSLLARIVTASRQLMSHENVAEFEANLAQHNYHQCSGAGVWPFGMWPVALVDDEDVALNCIRYDEASFLHSCTLDGFVWGDSHIMTLGSILSHVPHVNVDTWTDTMLTLISSASVQEVWGTLETRLLVSAAATYGVRDMAYLCKTTCRREMDVERKLSHLHVFGRAAATRGDAGAQLTEDDLMKHFEHLRRGLVACGGHLLQVLSLILLLCQLGSLSSILST